MSLVWLSDHMLVQSLDMLPLNQRVCVLVLGDIGHSPRIQYHALSLAKHFHVDVVGYSGSKPHDALLNNDKISLRQLAATPNFGNYLPRLLTYALKVVWQFVVFFFTLMSLQKPLFILVQNPPSIPTLVLVWLYSRLRGCRVVIDWHNYGFTILALSLSPDHYLVKLCRWIEGYFGSKADHHLCVTRALKKDLCDRWKISATVLYDRPPTIFQPISIEEKHDLFLKLKNLYPEFASSNDDDEETSFTIINENNSVQLKSERPAILISGTSWTDDEDFNLLLNSLDSYESFASNSSNQLPNLLCVITGKGPLKSYYQDLINQRNYSKIDIILPWLSAENYPKLLASADIGISLHKSSSGLDLPMKIVDMFGCCLPVCAYNYNCISELVRHGKNGYLFKDADELTSQLKQLLKGFPQSDRQLKAFRKNLLKELDKSRWDKNWESNALPMFKCK